jgi:putative toxin-antitoxin system antitoxin component (TIGR02293 family)
MTATPDIPAVASMLHLSHGASMTMVGLSDELKRGLNLEAFDSVAATIRMDMMEFRSWIISSRTYQRRVSKGGSFSLVESARLYRAAQTWTLAQSIYHDEDKARQFLTSPHAMLEGRRPLQLATESDAGFTAVENVLLGLKYGTAA